MYNRKLSFHFTGIGGSGMSGLAEILLNLGYSVSGSDQNDSAICDRLRAKGAIIYRGHSAQHLSENASLLVFSSAISQGNEEIIEARRRGLPVISRATVLAELMRLKFSIAVAGSHGKTTTTSMIAHVLESGGLDPTVVIGGQLQSIGSGARLGQGDYLVAETDESDKSFLLIKPSVAVVTNVDSEHLSAYGSFEELEKSFKTFVDAVPFYGLAVFCIDDPSARRLFENYAGRKVSYGFSEDAEVRACEVQCDNRGCIFKLSIESDQVKDLEVRLPLLGRHMIQNSLASFAVGREFEVSAEITRSALQGFSGVKRRLERVGQKAGVVYFSDYGHHPTEIRATLAALKEGWKSSGAKLHVVFEPHRYSRTKDSLKEFVSAFKDCDRLIVTEIYGAGEAPIEGVSGEALLDSIQHPSKVFVDDLQSVAGRLLPGLDNGDVVVFMGAGAIGHLPRLILETENY
jgi:UDP-N-acetylmuramate--alanine ligase